MEKIPLIDFSKISSPSGTTQSSTGWDELTEEVRIACHDIGFMYIVNHGIDPKIIRQAFEQSLKFFALPKDTKMEYLTEVKNKYRGYTCPGQEMLSPNSSYEFREAFAVVGLDTEQHFPDSKVPNFRSALVALQHTCHPVVKKLLILLAKALRLHDENYFVQANRGLDDHRVDNRCTLRTHLYPAIPENVEIPPNSVRCGAHTDYGCCTLLFQDSLGGLEVLNANDKWIPADPIEGSILVNLGDIMEKWTASYFKATCHRVLIPESERRRRSIRQSITYFIQTDDEYVVSQPESSLIKDRGTFEPFKFVNFLDKRIGDTYQY